MVLSCSPKDFLPEKPLKEKKYEFVKEIDTKRKS